MGNETFYWDGLTQEGLLPYEIDGSWDACLAPADHVAGADDIITNLAKEGEPRTETVVASNALPDL